MIIVLGVLLGVALVPATGGSLRHLDFFAFQRGIWLAFTVLLQVGMFTVPDGALPRLMHVGSFATAAVFLGANTHLPGMSWARLGGVMNLVAIVLNGGVMPARSSAWVASGLPIPDPDTFVNSRPADTVLVWLGDCIPMPAWVPGAAPFSVGDVLIALGIVVVLRHACGSSGRLFPGFRREDAPDDRWWWHLGERTVLEQSEINREHLEQGGRAREPRAVWRS